MGRWRLQLDNFPVNPITSHIEMDETLDNVVKKLAAHPQYPSLFKAAFGTNEITSERMIKALSQFQVMCISADSKYDKVKRSEGAQFSTDEQAGYTLLRLIALHVIQSHYLQIVNSIIMEL